MQKSKLGISVGVVGAATYLVCLFGGYIPSLLLVGFILLFEGNGWLKRTALKAIVISGLFVLAGAAIDFVPNVLATIQSIVLLFEGKFDLDVVYQVQIILHRILTLTKVVVMIALAAKALKQSTIVIGFVDKIVNKCVE